MRVLVVDDDGGTREVVRLTLAGEGHTVLTSADGDDVPAVVRAGGFDLLVLDLTLHGTGRSGITILEDLRAHGLELPVIVITGRVDPKDQDVAMRAGATLYLKKPFGPDELLAAVASVQP